MSEMSEIEEPWKPLPPEPGGRGCYCKGKLILKVVDMLTYPRPVRKFEVRGRADGVRYMLRYAIFVVQWNAVIRWVAREHAHVPLTSQEVQSERESEWHTSTGYFAAWDGTVCGNTMGGP